MGKSKYLVIGLIVGTSFCFAASFQDVAKQKKGTGEDAELFFRPQSSSSNAAQSATSPSNAADASGSKQAASTEQTPTTQKPSTTQGKWATSIRGVLKR